MSESESIHSANESQESRQQSILGNDREAEFYRNSLDVVKTLHQWMLGLIAFLLVAVGAVVSVAAYLGFSNLQTIGAKYEERLDEITVASEESFSEYRSDMQNEMRAYIAELDDRRVDSERHVASLRKQVEAYREENIEEANSFKLALSELRGEARGGVEAFLGDIQAGSDMLSSLTDLAMTTSVAAEVGLVADMSEADFVARMFFYEGLALAAKGEYENAVEAYHRSTEYDSDAVSPYFNLSNVLMKLGRFDEGLKVLDHAIGEIGYHTSLVENKAVFYLNGGYPERAAEYLAEHLPDDGSSCTALEILAMAYYSAGEMEKARTSAESLLECDATAGYVVLAAVSSDENLLEQAREFSDMALELSPNNAEAIAQRGVLEENSGNHTAAEDYYLRALSADSRDAFANRSYATYLLGEERFREAIPFLRTARGVQPWNPELHTLLGWSHWMLGESALAEPELKRALELGPSHSGRISVFVRFMIDRGRLGEIQPELDILVDEFSSSWVDLGLVVEKFRAEGYENEARNFARRVLESNSIRTVEEIPDADFRRRAILVGAI